MDEADSFAKFLNSSFLVTIAKVEEAANNLVRSVYKLIAKLLARRMTKVMDKLIGECQHAIVEERQVMDTTLVDNEVVDKLLSRNIERVFCKLDIEKAYHHLQLGFY